MRLVLILCCAAIFTATIFPATIFGQNLENDLKKSFRQFSVVKINDAETRRKTVSGKPLEIQINGRNYRFDVKPSDVRAADYNAEYTDKNGRHRLPRGEAYTYQGTIEGEPHSLVALTIDGVKVEGYFATASEGFFIETARNYSASAAADEKVIYRVADKVGSDDNICGLDESFTAGMNLAADDGALSKAEASTTRRILEVATEADKTFVLNSSTGNGDPAQANRHILSVMNQVDAVFRRDLNLRVVVTFQHAWTADAVDPYAGLNRSDLLHAFADYWNVKFPTTNPNYQRDVGHLFTLHGGFDGQAIASRICRGTAGSYSFTSLNNSNKWIITAHELAHNLGADHACSGTIMQAAYSSYATGFCQFTKDQIGSHINTYGDRCLEADTTAMRPTTKFDFDGDGRDDIAVFRPSNGFWYVAKSSGGFSFTQWGQQRDKLAPGDYDGDGRTDYAVYRALANMIIFPIPADDVFYILRSSDNGVLARSFQGNLNGGLSIDSPVPADYDGDGRTDLAIYSETDKNGTPIVFDILESSTGARIRTQWGLNTDQKIPGDYDGDGRADYAVYRDGTWFILQSSNGAIRIEYFGLESDKVVAGDYDGDGRADIAVWRPSNGVWYRLNSSDNSFNAVQFGIAEDKPVPADYDGDGKTDIAVFRPSTGTWYLQKSSEGFAAQQFGLSSDIPIPNVFVRN